MANPPPGNGSKFDRRVTPLKGLIIHEIKPVKFGGDPVDPANKVALTPAQHAEYTKWWCRIAREAQRG